MMKEYPLNYQRVEALTITGSRAWLMQGSQLVKTQRITEDIFFRITYHLIGLSSESANQIYAAINHKLFEGISSSLSSSFSNLSTWFKSTEQLEKEQDNALERYQQRIDDPTFKNK